MKNYYANFFVPDPAFLRSIESLAISSVAVELSTANIVSTANDFSSSNTIAYTVSYIDELRLTFC